MTAKTTSEELEQRVQSLEKESAELKQVSAALRESEEKLRELNRAVEQSFEGIGVADLEGKFVFVNPAWAQMHGYEVADLIGKPVGILDLPSNRERLPEIWDTACWKNSNPEDWSCWDITLPPISI